MVGVNQLLDEALSALREMSMVERAFRIFWLMGPLILLIERTPADVWVSIISIAFLVRAFIKRDFDWFRPAWVKAFLAFWLVCIVSSLTSSYQLFSLGESLIWARFPIFALASIFWLGTDRRLLLMMLVTSVIGMLLMSGILVAEFIYLGSVKTRLSWPYGDFNPGNYLAKVSLVALLFVFLAAMRASLLGYLGVLLLTSFVAGALFLTGERINFIIMVASLLLVSVLSLRHSARAMMSAIFVAVLTLIIGAQVAPDRLERYELIATSFISQAAKLVFEKSDQCYQTKRQTGDFSFYNKEIHTSLAQAGPGYFYYSFTPNWKIYKDGTAEIILTKLACDDKATGPVRIATVRPGSSQLFLVANAISQIPASGGAVHFLVRSSERGTYSLEVVDLENLRSSARIFEVTAANEWQYIELIFKADENAPSKPEAGQPVEFRFWFSSTGEIATAEFRRDWAPIDARTSPVRGITSVSDSIGKTIEIMGFRLGRGDKNVFDEIKVLEKISLDDAPKSDHLAVIRSGLIVLQHAPILGVGPGVYRFVAPELLGDLEDVRADNHPHNFVVQLFAETGVIGAIFGCIFLLLICVEGWRIMRNNSNDPKFGAAFVAPLAFFWPLSTQSDFFGQWNNVFIWSGVALALALVNLERGNPTSKTQ